MILDLRLSKLFSLAPGVISLFMLIHGLGLNRGQDAGLGGNSKVTFD
jgi:hypothetical protein